MSEARFGILHYDVPTNKKKQFAAYAKIRDVIRGKSVMLSRSCYLIPIGLKGALDRELVRVESAGEFGLRWGIIKFDPSENKKTQREVVLALQRMCKSAVAAFRRSCARAKALLAKSDGTIEDVADRSYVAGRNARRTLEDAMAAAIAFEEIGSVEDAIKAASLALEAEIEAEQVWEQRQGSTRKHRTPKDESEVEVEEEVEA